ncbi:MAG: hypothetical protein EOM00_12795 [Clostridia bacterium]|nr:hypothetical protein [Clostridia bacterium]
MKTILHYGVGYIKENYGLEALTRGTEIMLEQAFPEHQGYYICNRNVESETDVLGPFKHTRLIEADEKLPSIKSRLAWRLLRKHCLPELKVPRRIENEIDFALGVGGDIYTLANKDKTSWPYPWPVIKGVARLERMKIPYVLWCASVGPFGSLSQSKRIRLLDHLNQIDHIIVRETGSYDYLTQDCGLTNVTLAADPAFFMEPVVDESLSFLYRNRPVIAINISEAMIEYVFGRNCVAEEIVRLSRIISELLKISDFDVLLVPHTSTDFKTMKSIQENLSPALQNRVFRLPDWYGAQKTKWAISQCRLLICMRFHCSIAGLSSNTPTVLISSAAKGPRMFTDILGDTCSEMLIDMKEFDTEILHEKIDHLMNQRERIIKQISEANHKMQKRAEYAINKLKELYD